MRRPSRRQTQPPLPRLLPLLLEESVSSRHNTSLSVVSGA